MSGDDYSIPAEAKELAKEERIKIAAALLIAGSPAKEIGAKLGVSAFVLNRLLKTQEFKDELKSVSSELLDQAVHTFRGAMQELIPEALEVIKKNLKRGNLEAVKVIMKTIGVDNQPTITGGGNIQVVLPGGAELTKTEKEVKAEVNND